MFGQRIEITFYSTLDWESWTLVGSWWSLSSILGADLASEQEVCVCNMLANIADKSGTTICVGPIDQGGPNVAVAVHSQGQLASRTPAKRVDRIDMPGSADPKEKLH
jgi:hypothetical protein